MKLKSVLPSLTFLLLAPAMELHAAPFASGNLVIHRVGSGSGSLLNTGNPVFLDEYNTTGTLVQSIALPTTVSGANKRLVSSRSPVMPNWGPMIKGSAGTTCLEGDILRTRIIVTEGWRTQSESKVVEFELIARRRTAQAS